MRLPRGQGQLCRIEQVITGSDGHSKGACVRTQTKTGRSTVLQRPVELLYPLEINCQLKSDDSQDEDSTTVTAGSSIDHTTDDTANQGTGSRPQRAAAVRAHSRVAAWMTD